MDRYDSKNLIYASQFSLSCLIQNITNWISRDLYPLSENAKNPASAAMFLAIFGINIWILMLIVKICNMN